MLLEGFTQSSAINTVVACYLSYRHAIAALGRLQILLHGGYGVRMRTSALRHGVSLSHVKKTVKPYFR